MLRFHVASLGQVPSHGRNGYHHSHPKVPAQNVVFDRESKGGTNHDRYLTARSQGRWLIPYEGGGDSP